MTQRVLVVGLGVVGLSTGLELARRRHRVIGIDQADIGHPLGSSTGTARGFRVAYADTAYVQLALEALECWRSLERDEGRPLLYLTGQLDIGAAEALAPIRSALEARAVAFADLDPAGARRRFPEFTVDPAESVMFHADAGTVLADTALAALASAATRCGATLQTQERALTIVPTGDGARVITTGRVVDVDTVVIATGPWANQLACQVGRRLPLAPGVGQVTFFDQIPTADRPGLVDWAVRPDTPGVYGHPVPGVGYKLGFDAAGTDPWRVDAVDWPPSTVEEAELAAWAGRRFAGIAPRVLRSQRHPWTLTPDEDFAMGRVGPAVIACGCSGHAFKFGPALGRFIADVADGIEREEAPLFAIDRPALLGSAPDPSQRLTR